MDIEHLKRVAALAGCSVPTASKVLNHCGGVDGETRDRVLACAEKVPAAPERTASSCDIYFIVPDVPTFFWRYQCREYLRPDKRYISKHNVYTALHDTTLTYYLEEASRLDAKVVVAVCNNSVAYRAALEKTANERLLILLSEYVDIPNAFYVGSDAYADGARLGEYARQHTAGQLVVLEAGDDNVNCRRRTEGFLSQYAADVLTVTMPTFGRLLPAKTAALLSELPEREKYILYAACGGTESIELAALKAGILPRTALVGHDLHERKADSRIAAAINQNVEEQAREAVRIAERYLRTGGECPTSKCLYVESELCEYDLLP